MSKMDQTIDMIFLVMKIDSSFWYLTYTARRCTSQLGAGHYAGSRLLAQFVERGLSSVHYCEDHFHIHFFNKKQNGTFSSIF